MHSFSLGPNLAKHKDDIAPPINPMARAPPGLVKTPHGAPMMTPPAKDAFNTSSISIFPYFLMRILIAIAEIQLPVKDKIVLLITSDF